MQARRWLIVALGLATLPFVAADWPQWRGVNRDGKVTGFQAPATGRAELKQGWDVNVGAGGATPALVGDKLYVHTREGADEIIRCLEAASGKEIWQDKHAVRGADGPASGFAGPRCTPAVADGKVVTLGARGQLSCYEAESGKKLWSKDDFRAWPQFYHSASPLIVDGLVVAQLGGRDGSVAAYDLTSGEQKWKWSGAPTSYSSPMVMTVDGAKLIIGQVGDGIVAINAADGKHVWEVFFEGGGSRYKAATPLVDGDTLIYLDGPATAIKLAKEGEKVVSKNVWKNDDSRVEYNTPVLKDGLLYGISGRGELFCVNTLDGKTAWSAPMTPPSASAQPAPPPSKGKSKGGRGGGGGYGSVVDAGSVLFALTPSAQLVVFEPTNKEFKQLASYKVADRQTHAYPIVTEKGIYVKDSDSLTLWTLE